MNQAPMPATTFFRRLGLALKLGVWLFVGGLATTPAWAQADTTKKCAMVVMHGKWGNPQYISFFARKIEPTCAFKSIEMPWSARRSYDEPYSKALEEITAQVAAFRAEGYRQVLLAGHSFGANAAMAYMTVRDDVDGIITLAPGHSPAVMYERGIGKSAVDAAQALVASGKGDERLTMEDFNQGKRQPQRMRADVLWSYFNPTGLGHMPATAAAFRKPVPFLWVIGTGDPLYRAGEAFAYNRAPTHPASRYLVVEADHASTPDVAAQQVKAWIEALP
jgi:pimeloyl-ACP methyl ester carboxylesterase